MYQKIVTNCTSQSYIKFNKYMNYIENSIESQGLCYALTFVISMSSNRIKD